MFIFGFICTCLYFYLYKYFFILLFNYQIIRHLKIHRSNRHTETRGYACRFRSTGKVCCRKWNKKKRNATQDCLIQDTNERKTDTPWSHIPGHRRRINMHRSRAVVHHCSPGIWWWRALSSDIITTAWNLSGIEKGVRRRKKWVLKLVTSRENVPLLGKVRNVAFFRYVVVQTIFFYNSSNIIDQGWPVEITWWFK